MVNLNKTMRMSELPDYTKDLLYECRLDSDKKTAENFGIDYFDVEDFKQYVELNKCNTKL